ncbi:MAG: multiple sugar transport system substrate-binding protein [Chloroflexota bacterium]|jgi:multiple sugar transport system substrate-binding protein|nr:multiple sugar transport system substrate-binding protein [Chloroflexota bacterium]
MTDSVFSRQYSRRSMLKAGLYGVAGLAAAPTILEACASTSTSTSSPGGGKIVMGTFTDNAMTPIRDIFNKRFTAETGIQVQYNETSYDAWYQASKNDGLQKTGAYDIYVMDDNWVPEFAAGNVIQSLDKLGFNVNPDILTNGLNQGYWPPKVGAKMKDFATKSPELYAIVIIDDVEILYYNKDYFPNAPKTWDDIAAAAMAKAKPGKLFGWSARGVKGNPIVQTYLPLLNSYGGNFVNDDWSPGFAGPEGVGALERLFSFIPYMPSGVAEFDTDQETQSLLQGNCLALTEYTGLSHLVDDASQSKVAGKINMAATPSQAKSGPAIGTFICGIASGAKNPQGAKKYLEWFTSAQIQMDFAKTNGSAAVTKSALTDPSIASQFRWLPAIADAVNNSIAKPHTPDEPKMEDILGTHLNEALVQALQQKTNYHSIAQSALTKAGSEITAYLKQQGGYF